MIGKESAQMIPKTGKRIPPSRKQTDYNVSFFVQSNSRQ